MGTQKSTMPIVSELNGYKVGDFIYTADFGSDDGKTCDFDIKKFEIKNIVKNNVSDGKETVYAEIIDVRFPKAIIKSDLNEGFFENEELAAKAFVTSIHYIFNESVKRFEERFEKKVDWLEK